MYITLKMSKQLKQLEKHTFNAEEALNILFSNEYTLGTSSSDKSFSQLSYLEDSTDRNAESPSPKQKKWKKMLHVRHKHGKSYSVGVSQTHVQPTSNVPLLPQAAKKSDTPSTKF